MKNVVGSKGTNGRDFYNAVLAPVNHHHQLRFTVVDALLLAVLFVEITTIMRHFLAA